MRNSISGLSLTIAILFTTAIQPQSHSLESPLLSIEAERQLSLMRTSIYQHRTDVDESSGRFNYDCSGFLDYSLQKISPEAYAELPISKPSSKRPLAEDFHTLFSQSAKQSNHWQRIRKVSNVRAGDIVVWLRPIDNDSNNTGHVMVVKSQPTINPQQQDEVLIPVIDSTTSPHDRDSRSPDQTGLGTGTIGIIINRKGEPLAYHWRGGKSKRAEKTPIAFGRLR